MITGKEAKMAWANGETIQYNVHTQWHDVEGSVRVDVFDRVDVIFRLKPRTITINSIEVPAPFEPKEGDIVWYLTDSYKEGYGETKHRDKFSYVLDLTWKTEDEIKQVVEALRQAFKQ